MVESGNFDIPTNPFFLYRCVCQFASPGRTHNVPAMHTQPQTVIIQSTFFGFRAYATTLPDVVVTGKNVPEAKTKLNDALRNHFSTGGSALAAEVTYHIVY